MRLSSSRSWDLCTLLGTGVLSVLGWLLPVGSPQALPSFSRQTGEACTACHVQTWGADLLPRGRDFKLRGYTDGDGSSSWIPPVSATIDGSVFTYLDPGRGEIASADSSYKASLFYAGRIVDHLGSYFSLSYENYNGYQERYFLDKLDFRFANEVDVGGVKVNYGITANNQPGLQDLWNTFPPWNFPWAYWGASHFTEMDGLRAGKTGGASIYSMIGDWVYLEAGAYASLPRDVQRGIGRSGVFLSPSLDLPQLDGGAPYWRFAIQHTLGNHYFSLGHFGLIAETSQPSFFSYLYGNPMALRQNRTRATDVGIDATYQFLGNPDHIFELKGTYLRESVESRSDPLLSAGVIWVQRPPLISLTEFVRVNAAYTWAQTIGISFGYHRQSPGLTGSYSFLTRQGPGDLEAYFAELAFTPFGKSPAMNTSWLNLRLSLMYGGDLHGRSENDVVYFNGSLAF